MLRTLTHRLLTDGSVKNDPNFNQTVLLLHGDGTNGAQNNTFLDSSTNNFSITRNGNTTQGTFSPFSLAEGQWSNFFDGSGDELTTPANAAFNFGSGDFTVEFWINSTQPAGAFGKSIVVYANSGGASNTNWSFFSGTNLKVNFYASDGSTYQVTLTSTTTVIDGAWHHIAATRSGNSFVLFIDGVSEATGSWSGSITSTNRTLRIGDNGGSTNYAGYVSNVRIVKGTAVYTSNFTPPTTPLTAITNTSLLTCQSNRFVDNSSNAFAITANGDVRVTPFSPFAPSAAYSPRVNGGSGYFDGSGDYLQATISALAGTFTVEFWAFRPAAGNNFFYTIGDSSTTSGSEIYIGTSGTQLNYYSNGSARINGGTPPAAGQWEYIAVTRDSSNVVRMYVNGSQVGSTYTQATTLGTVLRVGAEFYNNAVTGTLNGYMGPFRVSDNVRTVTSVPTAPFTSDGNTVFLLNFTNAGIFDQTGKNNLETVGDAQIDTTTKKFGTGSMEFDGTGDYLVTNGDPNNFAFGTGDFTIEMWVYFNTTSGVEVIYDSRSSNGLYPTIYRDGTAIKYFTNSDNQITSSTITTGTWYHLALTRSGTNTKMFIDGTQSGSTYSDSNAYLNASQRPFIGATGVTGFVGDFGLNGYIDDLRITKGIARYTANFTPPAVPFEDQ